jgi:hypothetical protein
MSQEKPALAAGFFSPVTCFTDRISEEAGICSRLLRTLT